MSDPLDSRALYSQALTIPWQMTAEALEAFLSIAAREPLPEDEIARRMHGPRSLALRSGQRREDSGRMTMRDGVAVIPIDGPIYRYADVFTRASGGVTTDALALDFGRAMEDPAVRAVLLVSDSPGGEITGVGELSAAIKAARGRKPIGAYVEGYGASATYRIISAADIIIVDADAMVGSIGTIMGVPDPTKWPSYRIDFVSKQSPKKRPDVTTDAGRAVIQEMVDRLTDVFVAQVAENRGISEAAVLAVEGGMLIGQDAIDAGLADQLGSEESAIRALWAGAAPVRRTFIMARPSGRAQQEVTRMAVDQKGFWASFWGGAKDAGIVPEATEQATHTPASAAQPHQSQPDPRAEQIAAENAELRKQLGRVRAEQIQKDAQVFAAAELAANRAYPAEQDALAAMHARAAETDQTHPRGDGQPSCVALMTTWASARPAHTLSKPALPSAPGTVLANVGGEDDDLTRAEASARAYGKRRNGKKPA